MKKFDLFKHDLTGLWYVRDFDGHGYKYHGPYKSKASAKRIRDALVDADHIIAQAFYKENSET